MVENFPVENGVGITIDEVIDYFAYLKPYQVEKIEPNVSEQSKSFALAIKMYFGNLDGMLNTTTMYFYEGGQYKSDVEMIFKALNGYIYPLITDIVENKLQSNWYLFLHDLTYEAFGKSGGYSDVYYSKLEASLVRDSSIEKLKIFTNADDLDYDLHNESAVTDIKAELFYFIANLIREYSSS